VERAGNQARQSLLGQQPVLPLAPCVTGGDPDQSVAIDPRGEFLGDTGFLVRRQRARLGGTPLDLDAR